MTGLTEAGREAVRSAASRHGVSEDAAEAMLHALVRGGGSMAQFNIPELGGNGQWMAGGMTMVGDIFNSGLQAQVAGLASDLSQAMSTSRLVEAPKTTMMSGHGWWPDGLGQPSSTGGQNDISYAVFPSTRRLAVQVGGRVYLFDTGNHVIGGVSQSQSGGGLSTLSFQSQLGNLAVVELPRVEPEEPEPRSEGSQEPRSRKPETGDTVRAAEPEPKPRAVDPEPVSPKPAPEPAPEPEPKQPAVKASASAPASGSDIDTILTTIERLAELRDKGALTEAEFDAKKVELLSRL